MAIAHPSSLFVIRFSSETANYNRNGVARHDLSMSSRRTVGFNPPWKRSFAVYSIQRRMCDDHRSVVAGTGHGV